MNGPSTTGPKSRMDAVGYSSSFVSYYTPLRAREAGTAPACAGKWFKVPDESLCSERVIKAYQVRCARTNERFGNDNPFPSWLRTSIVVQGRR